MRPLFLLAVLAVPVAVLAGPKDDEVPSLRVLSVQ